MIGILPHAVNQVSEPGSPLRDNWWPLLVIRSRRQDLRTHKVVGDGKAMRASVLKR